MRKPWMTSILIIMGVGAFLRLSGLLAQDLIFYDEGQILRRAMELRAWRGGLSGKIPDSLYIDTKLFWISFIALARTLLPTSFLAGKLLSVLAGLGTVGVTYLLAWDRYRSRRLAIWSALGLAVSGAHVFASRLVMPDAAAAFLALLSVYLYGREARGRFFSTGTAGVAFGAAFLTHYRIAPFVVLFFLIEGGQVLARERCLSVTLIRLITLLATALLTVLVFEILIVSLTGLSFLENVTSAFRSYSRIAFDPAAFFAFPYFVYLYDGPWPLLGLAMSLFFVRGKYPTGTFLAFLLIYLIFCSFSLFKYARLIVPILPVIAILAGTTIENILGLTRGKGGRRTVVALAVILMALNARHTFRDSREWKTYIKDTAAWVKTNRGGEKILLATNAAIFSGYLPGRAYYLLQDQKAGTLPGYFEKGIKLVIIDPHKFAISAYQWGEQGGPPTLINEIEMNCQPVASFPAFSPALFERFMHEHAYPSLMETLKIREYLDENKANRFDIYDVPSCIQALKSE